MQLRRQKKLQNVDVNSFEFTVTLFPTKYGPIMPFADMKAQTVVLGEWSGFWYVRRGLSLFQYGQLYLFTCPLMWKWASSVNNTFSRLENYSSIMLANDLHWMKSFGFIYHKIWSLYGCNLRSRCKIRRRPIFGIAVWYCQSRRTFTRRWFWIVPYGYFDLTNILITSSWTRRPLCMILVVDSVCWNFSTHDLMTLTLGHSLIRRNSYSFLNRRRTVT